MDPFTEKLLARTQARKAALTHKREEVARRSPAVNSPRRPLVENNANGPSTPITTKSVQATPSKGTPVVVTSAPFAGGTPKSVFYEKYSKQACLKQKECFIELGEVKQSLKRTTTTDKFKDAECTENKISNSKKSNQTPATIGPIEKIQKVSLANTDSPSVKDRKAMYMKQVKVDSITGNTTATMTTKQEHEKTMNKSAERVYPSVKEPRASLAGGRFFNDPRSTESSIKASEKVDPAVPVKPPRATASKSKSEGEPVSEEPAKPPQAATNQAKLPPSKPPRVQVSKVSSVDIKLTNQPSGSNNVKRKAPAPPPEDEEPTKMTNELNGPKATKRCEEEVKTDIPKKKSAIEGSNSIEVVKGATKSYEADVNTEPAKKSAFKRRNGYECVNDATKSSQEEVKTNIPDKSVIKKSNRVENGNGAAKRCEEEVKSDIPNKKSAIEGSNGVKEGNTLTPNKDLLSAGVISPIVNESTPNGQTSHIKRTLKSQKISAISLDDMPTDAHEITFNIDMTEFDQVLEEEKESMFQMTYDERIVKAAEGKTTTEEPNNYNDHETSAPAQPMHKGVHTSGYHSVYSDQYAAVVTPKKAKSAPKRHYTVHEKIQMLLEEAAYQQNIVLQASQAVNTCLALHDGANTGSSEEIEAERLLKFSTERRTACLNEVQKLKNGEDTNYVDMNGQSETETACKATLTVSEIKIPVDQKLLQNKNPLEPCIYSFICMVKHNPKQMYCTKAVTSEEINNGCIIFDDTFHMKSVEPSFSLDISLFLLKTQLPSATPTNKHKRKTMIAKSVLDSPKIKQIISSAKKSCDGASQAVTPGATHGPVFRTSGFTLVSTAVVNLDNVHHGRYNATQVGEKYYLNGDLKINVTCNPEYSNEAKGFLTIFEDVGGLGDWLRYWCILDGNVLRYWKYPDEELIKPPLGLINLAYCTSDSVTVVPRDICARPHTMQLVLKKHVTNADRETLIAVNAGGKRVIKYMLSADTKADKLTWISTLNDSLKDWRAWHCNLPIQKTKKRSETDVIML